jgi:hypothetical protein
MMQANLAADLWEEIKRYVNTVDRPEAADTIVNFLIDNDEAAEDILEAFKHDADIKRALAEYLDDTPNDDEDDIEFETYSEWDE